MTYVQFFCQIKTFLLLLFVRKKNIITELGILVFYKFEIIRKIFDKKSFTFYIDSNDNIIFI